MKSRSNTPRTPRGPPTPRQTTPQQGPATASLQGDHVSGRAAGARARPSTGGAMRMRLSSGPPRGPVCACARRPNQEARGARSVSARHLGARWIPAPGACSSQSIFMAFAPMGPEPSFFQALDQHRAALLAALRRGGGEAAGGVGTRLASGYEGSAGGGARAHEVESEKVPWPGGGAGVLCRELSACIVWSSYV